MGFFKSKKFSAFVIGVVVLILTQVLGIAEDVAQEIAALIGTYLLGQGFADGVSKGATSSMAGSGTSGQ